MNIFITYIYFTIRAFLSPIRVTPPNFAKYMLGNNYVHMALQLQVFLIGPGICYICRMTVEGLKFVSGHITCVVVENLAVSLSIMLSDIALVN